MIEERFEINPSTTGITATDGAGATWHADIWDFKVELGQEITLHSGDRFSCYLIGDDAAEMPATTLVRVVKRDVANEGAIIIVPNVQYQKVKAYQSKHSVFGIKISLPMVIRASEHIVVMVNGADATGTGDTDASASNFKLLSIRERLGV